MPARLTSEHGTRKQTIQSRHQLTPGSKRRKKFLGIPVIHDRQKMSEPYRNNRNNSRNSNPVLTSSKSNKRSQTKSQDSFRDPFRQKPRSPGPAAYIIDLPDPLRKYLRKPPSALISPQRQLSGKTLVSAKRKEIVQSSLGPGTYNPVNPLKEQRAKQQSFSKA